MSAVSDTDAYGDSAAYYEAQRHKQWSTRTHSISEHQLRGRPVLADSTQKPRRRLSHGALPLYWQQGPPLTVALCRRPSQ